MFPLPIKCHYDKCTTYEVSFIIVDNVGPICTKGKGCMALLKWTVYIVISHCSCIVHSRNFKQTEVSHWNAPLLPVLFFSLPSSAFCHGFCFRLCFNSNSYTLHSRRQHCSPKNKTPMREKKKMHKCYWNTETNLKSASSSSSF